MKMTAFLKTTAIAFCTSALLFLAPINAHAAISSPGEPVASLTVNETTTYHESFAAALSAANEANVDCSITLLQDSTETGVELFYSCKSKGTVLTIDFGACTLTCDELKSRTAVTMNLTGTTGGINGNITILGPNNDPFAPYPPCSIDGGVYRGTIFLPYYGSDLVINDGTFYSSGTLISIGSDSFKGDIAIKGGSFPNGLRVSGVDLEETLGYNKQFYLNDVPVTLSEGQTELSGNVKVGQMAVAKVDGTYYTDLDSAAAAFASNSTFTLLEDCWTSLDGGHWITLSGSGTFDLNGHNLEATGGSSVLYIAEGSGPITIKDSSAEKAGEITGTASYSIWHEGTGEVTVESGTYQNFGRFGNGSLIINGGTFKNYSFGNTFHAEAKVVLNGGIFEKGIWFTSGNNQTVYEILGDGKTYQKGDQIWPRDSIEALGEVYEFEKGNTVTVTDETNLIASYTIGTATYYYTTLASAIEKYNSEDFDESKCVTLLRDTKEHVTISEAIYMIFEANATGVFTFSGSAIYLKEALPSNVSLQVKLDPYSTKPKAVLVRHNYGDFDLERNDITLVDADAKVEAYVNAIYVYHEHSWVYKQDDEHTVSAVCEYTESCTQAKGAAFATTTLHDTAVTYNGQQQHCSLETEAESEYNGTLPASADIAYYDESGSKLDGAPTDVGTYTAKVSFGDKTMKAELKIEPATPTASDFAFAPPLNQRYDGQAKHASVEPESSVRGMGDIAVAYYDSEGNLLDGAPVDAGTYGVKISVAESVNYKAAEGITDESWQFTIEPKEIGVEWATEPLVYNGKVQSPAATATGIVDGDDVQLVVAGGKKDVSDTGTALVSITAISGEDEKNYALAKRDYEVQFSIIPRPLTVDVVVEDKHYDGTNVAFIASAELKNVAEGDEVGLTNGIATFDSVQVANNINVSFTDFVLTGDEEVLENYMLIQPTGITASIIDNPEAANPGKGGKDNIAPTGDNSPAATIALISAVSGLAISLALRRIRRSA